MPIEFDTDDKNEAPRTYLALEAPRTAVKAVKVALENHGYLDKSFKISPGTHNHLKSSERFLLPTSIQVDKDGTGYEERDNFLKEIGLSDLEGIKLILICHRAASLNARNLKSNGSALSKVVSIWVHSLPPSVLSISAAKIDNLMLACRWSYCVYHPMLLLPADTFSQPPWPDLFGTLPEVYRSDLFRNICSAFKVTQIAANGPIPALIPHSDSAERSQTLKDNILRSPSALTPLWGDFGSPNLPATAENFGNTLWVSTVQNGISQIWAPLYTMFSRGNISEKSRILKMKSLTSASSNEGGLGRDPAKTTAIDLYAGIGYFAFSYAKAGAGKVLCWELNGWSVEGLRRGAEQNGWSINVIKTTDEHSRATKDYNEVFSPLSFKGERLVVFNESNTTALNRVRNFRKFLPPVRHVNCGSLPTSQDTWDSAFNLLDPMEGGWIHAHENIASNTIEERKMEVLNIFQNIVGQRKADRLERISYNVECQHIERVKTYAPGIIHCVFDIAIIPAPFQDS